jgi:hypothetical protein
MEIRLRSTGQVMMESEFRYYQKTNNGPTWDQTTDEILEALGADVVFNGPQAQPGRYQTAHRDGVEQLDGKWYTKYSVVDMDNEAKAALDAQQAASQRAERNRKLSETDWTQGKDIPDNVSNNWAVYRQQLRDVPAQAEFPWDINWPQQPE